MPVTYNLCERFRDLTYNNPKASACAEGSWSLRGRKAVRLPLLSDHTPDDLRSKSFVPIIKYVPFRVQVPVLPRSLEQSSNAFTASREWSIIDWVVINGCRCGLTIQLGLQVRCHGSNYLEDMADPRLTGSIPLIRGRKHTPWVFYILSRTVYGLRYEY